MEKGGDIKRRIGKRENRENVLRIVGRFIAAAVVVVAEEFIIRAPYTWRA